jgi:RimJ/RimL family protein N-acetyltransferase
MFAITERLLLRPGWAEDAPALARAIDDEKVVRNLAVVPWPYRLADAEEFLALPQEPLRPRFLIFRRTDGTLLGGIGLHGKQEAELGYWLAPEHWGHGYATEAGRAVVALADDSLRLPRLAACHALDNPASGKVLAKLGFRPGKVMPRFSAGRGAEMEVRLFARDRVAAIAQPLAA